MNEAVDSATQALHSPLAVFRDYLAKGQLAYQHDAEPGRAFFYPRVIGPGSGNPDLTWRISTGVGTVYAVTVISPRGEAPYNVVLIDMDDGFRMMSRVEGIEVESIRIGMRVCARVHHPADGQAPYPVFDAEVA
jgi:uncharacterized OB-fold protein